MLTFYYHPTPNPRKVALFLEEAGLPFTLVPVDTATGEQHDAAYRAVNPNGKVPAIDDDGTLVFDSNAILLYLAEKTGKFLGDPADRGDLLSWLMFIATGLGPFSGQSVHFHRVAPDNIPYAQSRYRKETERHYAVLNKHLKGRDFIVGHTFTIVDIAAWAWVDRAALTLGEERLGEYPEVERWFQAIDARPAVARARLIGQDIEFKTPGDEDSRRALYPSNYPD
ncbi:glutathione S-transferase family protein [Vreelandella subglaciescola]|jgi:GST-like protein|uniref:GST-like protein n=1 Tax=Vreelandella subglaciescola TaxID=29571 RepID=A0A1M7GSS9_9GAMM|nr:glutathione S-transferase N-terminal domain-containing protein [Halomonas subglaciescola]SHM19424.1 GST-like protein [Halomonas subglaciescola]